MGNRTVNYTSPKTLTLSRSLVRINKKNIDSPLGALTQSYENDKIKFANVSNKPICTIFVQNNKYVKKTACTETTKQKLTH